MYVELVSLSHDIVANVLLFTVITLSIGTDRLCKQCSPRSDTVEHSVLSTLFAIHKYVRQTKR